MVKCNLNFYNNNYLLDLFSSTVNSAIHQEIFPPFVHLLSYGVLIVKAGFLYGLYVI